MRQIDIDNVEIAWQNVVNAIMATPAAKAEDEIMDALMDMGWTLEALVNACQSLVPEDK